MTKLPEDTIKYGKETTHGTDDPRRYEDIKEVIRNCYRALINEIVDKTRPYWNPSPAPTSIMGLSEVIKNHDKEIEDEELNQND